MTTTGTVPARCDTDARLHLADPDLTPATIAAAHGISLRQLYKLCAEADLSLEQWIINERLHRIAGGADHIMPPSVNRSNAHHYKAENTVTEYFEIPGRSHWTCAEPGWEQVADKALDWPLTHAR